MTVTQTSDKTFQSDVLDYKGVVLVDFWAEWCLPCHAVAPVLDELAKIYADKAKIVKLNIDANPSTPMQYGIRSIPTLMLFKNGQLVQSHAGGLSRGILEDWIKKAL